MTRISLAFFLLLAGCADDIEPSPSDGDDGVTPDAPASTSKVTTTRDNATGTYTTVVDASAMDTWTYADFETGGEVDATAAWDLRFQRFHISTNGGTSGTGGVQIAPVTGTTFAALTTAPTDGWTADADDTNMDGSPDYAFEQGAGWYDYDPAAHSLTPKPIVYAIKTDGGSTLKLEIVKYYDDAGTSGWLTLHWGPL